MLNFIKYTSAHPMTKSWFRYEFVIFGIVSYIDFSHLFVRRIFGVWNPYATVNVSVVDSHGGLRLNISSWRDIL